MSDQIELEVAPSTSDRRVERTRAALRAGFNQLLLSRGYDGFTAADVAETAGVGRSTFYEHYQGKPQILASTLVPILAPLAECAFAIEPDERLIPTIQHFWDNRRLARAMMSGRAYTVMVKALSRLIEQQLVVDRPNAGGPNSEFPLGLVALQLAASQMVLLAEWLSGRHRASAQSVAMMVSISSRALVNGYMHITPS